MKKIFLVFLFIIIFSGCKNKTENLDLNEANPSSTEANPSSTEANPGPNEAYPGPNEAYPGPDEEDLFLLVDESGYPITNNNNTDVYKELLETIDFEKLVPGSENGSIIGTLLDNSGKPYLIDLYLAKTIDSGQEDYPYILAYSPNESMKALQAKDGKFLFENVHPGMYGIIAWNPISDIVLMDVYDKELIFSVGKGEIIDLGSIIIK